MSKTRKVISEMGMPHSADVPSMLALSKMSTMDLRQRKSHLETELETIVNDGGQVGLSDPISIELRRIMHELKRRKPQRTGLEGPGGIYRNLVHRPR